jgi:hypothetical protein
MRRALAILKYVPAVLCGVLVVAWAVTLLYIIEWRVSRVYVTCYDGTVEIGLLPPGRLRPDGSWAEFSLDWNDSDRSGMAGRFCQYPASRHFPSTIGPCTGVPISVLVTGLLVPCIAAFIRFRFPLWSYFAWTALVAAELAYYLR